MKNRKTSWKTLGLVGALIGSLIQAPKVQAGTIEDKVFYNTSESHARTELKVSDKEYKILADANGEDTRVGANLSNENLTLNAGYQEVADKEGTRTYAQVGGDTKLAGSYQTLEGKEDFWKTYITTPVEKSNLEAGFNSLDHLTAIARTPINKENSVALAGSISTKDGNYNRISGATAHSGKVGYLAYAIFGENEDRTQHRDFRIRGGLGGKTKASSIGAMSLNESCFFTDDIVFDITDPLSTGTFGNYTANIRGDPLGFDIRYCNNSASVQIAGKLGIVTFMPTYRYDTETFNQGLDLEVGANLGKGFTVRAQNRAYENKSPEQAVMLGYSVKF